MMTLDMPEALAEMERIDLQREAEDEEVYALRQRADELLSSLHHALSIIDYMRVGDGSLPLGAMSKLDQIRADLASTAESGK